jgi:phospholipid/cholesterol/gamma-HCH transport system substrate-binding protein
VERDRRLALVVGTFVLVAVGSLALAILSLTAERGIFVTRYRLVAYFENVQGLLPGAPVWLAGKEVGRVEAIDFEPVGSDHPLRVLMGIDVDVQDRIRSDSFVTIGTIGVLGDAYVEVTVGSADAKMLEPGDAIRAESPLNINTAVTKASRALDNVANLAENMNEVVKNFTSESGGQRAADAIAAGADVMIQIREGPGLLHSLIYREYDGQGVESVERSLALLENIMSEVAEGDGLLHTIIYDSAADQDVVRDVLAAVTRLNAILAKIDSGDGTLGLLVNDPTVYEDMQELLGGAKRSVVVRSLVRMLSDEGGKD